MTSPSVLIALHPDRAEAAEVALDLVTWLEGRGYRVVMDAEAAAGAALVRLTAADDVLEGTGALAVCLGGDGTMLATFERVARYGIPVLGIHLGNLGYLTEFEPSETIVAVQQALDGELPIEERMMVSARIERADGSMEGPWDGLNEVVVEKRAQGHTVRLAVSLDDVSFATYAADGLIVATPTGSTGYSMSARGAIVDPSHRALQLTPVAPHMLFDRSLLLQPETSVRIAVVGDREANCSVDGRSVAVLQAGDSLVATAAATPALLVTSGQRGFHQVLREKFGLKDR